ncbi:MAG: hypothetical protein E6G56_08620 [Actinobacteria bacterium]|nr:MAG: hypothetical protein E6G56_08620 [Actinomycetota bacterium]
MSVRDGDTQVDVAVDNDVLLKAACYGIAQRFWPHAGEEPAAGVLGAARFVIASAIARGSRVRDKAAASKALAEFLSEAAVLEPTNAEVGAAAELERLAQLTGLELDVGESQLAAMTAGRDIALLDTGDKRAVRGLEILIDLSETCAQLGARVRCLEQLFLRVLDEKPGEFEAIARAVCAEPAVDKTASICFGCYSGGGMERDAVLVGLESYVGSLRTAAPRVLAG